LPRLRGAFSFGGRAVWREVCKAVTARADAFATDLAPTVAELQAAGATSLRAIARGLNERGIRTPRGVGEWKAGSVAQLLARLA
jgi:Recombinase